MRTIRETLAAQPLFAGLDGDTLDLLAGCARHQRLKSGARITVEGQPAGTFHLIREGRVGLGVYAPERGLVTVETLGRGQVLGWSWLFPPYRWHLDAAAVGPVATIEFDGVCIRGKCDANPELGYQMMKRFSGLLDEHVRAMQLRLLDVYTRGPGD